MMKIALSLFMLIGLIVLPLYAGEVDVVQVKVKKTGAGEFRFDVTLSHQDEGWKHYADKWDILAPDGTILGTRTLLHPHVEEQPFTRSLSGVQIPQSVQQVIVRGHDSVHQYGGLTKKVDIPH